ncbi:ABC transporter substrate-binding protein [Devosia nitrariae]|uniref:ABC transporter substrate-binding protein n=1 Tax=Devosia nitrariae TaxID=2071872 RepID=A0ABQ5W6B0_9HYPH|nr:sugar ABC transporter substrate-binding protein [Devosia nitrariae]GLQ55599.1 ABC transporter substrate-binding protein [Devosia nitrariae]
MHRYVVRGFVTAAAVVATTALASAQDVELVQWQTNLRPPDIEGITALTNRFMELHPDIRIQIESTPWDTHPQKILAAFNAGSGLPDVGRIGNLAQAAAVGYVQPLDEYIDQAWRDSIFDVAWADAEFSVDGQQPAHIWGVPKMLATEVWFYNKTMFDAAGLDPESAPQSVEEFKDIACQLTLDTDGDGRVDQWGVNLTAGAEGGPVRQYTMAAHSFGGRLVEGSYVDSQIGDEITWNSEGTVEGFNWLKSMYDEGCSPPSTISDTVRDVANNFRAGRVAMAFMGPWELELTKQTFEENGWEFGLMRFPEGPGGRGEFAYVGALGMFSQTQHPEEVIEYLKFYTSAEGLALYMHVNGMIPANKEALADPFYSEDPYYATLLETINSADLPAPKWLGLRGAGTLMDTIWTPLYQRMLAGEISVEDGVKEMHDSLAASIQ